MNKKISLGLALSLVAIASAVTFILTSFFTLQSFNKKIVDVNEKAKKYSADNSYNLTSGTLTVYIKDKVDEIKSNQICIRVFFKCIYYLLFITRIKYNIFI